MQYSVGQEIRPNSAVPTGQAPGSASFSYGQLSPTAPGKVIGTRSVNGQDYYNIDQRYIGGGTGWVQASLVDNPSPAPASPSYNTSPSPSTASATPRLDFVNTLMSQFQADEAKRQEASSAARQKLVDYYAGLEDPTARFTRLNTEQGVTEQQNLVNGLTKDVMNNQDLIDALEGSVNTRSGDFLINDAQRTALLARERYPLEQNLTKLLRQKQYEEVGLAGKQQLVNELLQLSFQNDVMKAKPLELGVDYTDKDAEIARQIFSDMANRETSAFNADQSATEARNQAATEFAQKIQLENLTTQNNIAEYNATTGAKKTADNTAQKLKDQAQNVYNGLVGNSNSEYEIWKKIYDNRDLYAKMGIIDELWNLHGAFKASLQKKNIVQ